MRKINLKPYQVEPVEPQDKPIEYGVKRSLINLLFGPHNNLNAQDLLSRDDLAREIRAADESVLIEDAEYCMLEAAIRGYRGYGEYDVEFVKRVLEAPQVKVEEKKTGETE